MTKSGAEMDGRAGRFAGKTALVTGTSDRGIGGAIAHRLAKEGATLALASRTEPERLLDLLTHCKRRFQFYACDVMHDDEVRAVVAACHDQFGALDIVVNNAGIECCRPLEQVDDLALTELLDTNLLGAIRVTRAALPHLRSPGGVIVNISSALSQAGSAGYSVYSASKAGLNGFTQSLAWELAPRGIRVVAVAPGVVLTGMTTKYVDQLTPEAAHQVRQLHPLDVGLAGDVASAVAFLASDEARWITGIILPLGWTPAFPLPLVQEAASESQTAEAQVMAR